MQEPTYRNLKDLLGNKYGMGATNRYAAAGVYEKQSRPESRSSSRQGSRSQTRQQTSRPNSKQGAPIQQQKPVQPKSAIQEEIQTFNKMMNYFQKAPSSGQQSNYRTPANTNTSFNSFLQDAPPQKPQAMVNKLHNYLDQSITGQPRYRMNHQFHRTPPPPQSTPKQLGRAIPQSRNSRNNSNNSRNASSSSFTNQQPSQSPTTTSRQQAPQYTGRQRERGDVSLNQPDQLGLSQLKSSRKEKDDFNRVSMQREANQKAEYLQKIMQQPDKFKRQPHHQQQFFQLSPTPQQQMQSPQFKGNLELMQLIRSQAPKEELPNEDDDETLIVDNYAGVAKQHFIFHFVIGKGGFGKVWKVELKKSRSFHAMKEMSKSKIIAKRSVNSVMNEKELLTQLRHPQPLYIIKPRFLVNMLYAFQDRQNLYLVMDLLTGGDLRFHVGRMRKFKEHQTKFFVACIMVGLEYLHNNNVIHRDIKPENLVLDRRGYVRITDLGIARKVRLDNASDTSGTPGYMAPEVMYHQNHGIAVDYFALGVIAYEFMLGRRPYNGRSRKEIREQVLAKNVQIKKEETQGWSPEGIDFVNRLIQRKPQNRLGYNGPAEVKAHPWLKTVPWDKLEQKLIDPPYIPSSIDDNFDYRQQISEDNDSQDELIQQNAILLRKNSVQNLFAGYSYDGSNAVKGTKTTASTNSTNNYVTSQVDTFHHKNF